MLAEMNLTGTVIKMKRAMIFIKNRPDYYCRKVKLAMKTTIILMAKELLKSSRMKRQKK